MSNRNIHWNEEDTVPEIDTMEETKHHVTELCRIPLPEDEPKAKAKGVHFLAKKDDTVKFVIVYDSVINGAPTVFSCQLEHS